MGLDHFFKNFGGHHGGHHGGGHHDERDSHHNGHGGHNYGYPNQCGPNTTGQNVPAPAAGQRPCPKCAEPVQAGFKFCSSCGACLEAAACNGCGAKLPQTAAFCPGCGAKVLG